MNEAILQRLTDASRDPFRVKVDQERDNNFELFLMRLHVRVDEMNETLRTMYQDPEIKPSVLIEYAEGVAREYNEQSYLAGIQVGLIGEAWIPKKVEDDTNGYRLFLAKEPINGTRTLHDLGVVRCSTGAEGEPIGPQIGLRFVEGPSDIRYFEGTVYGIAELSQVVITDNGLFEYDEKPRDVNGAVRKLNTELRKMSREINKKRGLVTDVQREEAVTLLGDLYELMPPALSPKQIIVSDGLIGHMYLYNQEDKGLRRRYPKEGAGRLMSTGRLEVIGFKLPAALDPAASETGRVDETSLEDGIGLVVRYDTDENSIMVIPTSGDKPGKLSIETV